MNYQDLVYERCFHAITDFDSTLASEIYALGLMYGTFWSADAHDVEVAYQGIIWFRYNTLSEFKRSICEASEAMEAKWNPSFWCEQTREIAPRSVEYGEEPNDDELTLRDEWCASIGITPKQKSDVGNPRWKKDDGRPKYEEPELYRATISLCQSVIQQLHANEITVSQFGQPIPIVIYDDECGADIRATLAANPQSEALKELCA